MPPYLHFLVFVSVVALVSFGAQMLPRYADRYQRLAYGLVAAWIAGFAMHYMLPARYEWRETGVAVVEQYQKNQVVRGGTMTLVDSKGYRHTVPVSPDMEMRTQHLFYSRDPFFRQNVDLNLAMWYWEPNQPVESGHMVIHRVS